MKRINRGHFAAIEQKVLDFTVQRIPNTISPDHLTLGAFLSAFLGFVFYILSNQNIGLILLVNSCLFFHWLFDGLDGRLARYRNKQRPNYGYYIDHILDSFSTLFFLGGVSLSSSTTTSSWFWVLAVMFISMIHIYLKATVTKEFSLDIQGFGGTEARFGLIALNFLIFFHKNTQIILFNKTLFLVDLVGWIVFIGFIFKVIPDIIKTVKLLDINDRKKW